MGHQYKHLTEADRQVLGMMLTQGQSKSAIAHSLGVHRSTVYREITRNRNRYLGKGNLDCYFYAASLAHRKYLKRRKRCSKLMSNSLLRSYVHERLKKGWSPWQIEGRLRSFDTHIGMITHETIYRYIYSNTDKRNHFYKKLRRRHPYRIRYKHRTKRIPTSLLIDNRPNVINRRETFGHWECDLMMFNRGIKGNLITLRERKSRFIIAIKNISKSAHGTGARMLSELTRLKDCIHSITFDQGGEFMKYAWLQDRLNTAVYFCHPASPEEKGCVENGNGLIRVEIPRQYNIALMSEQKLRRVIDNINRRPLKCLNYQTPFEVFTCHLAQGS